MWKRIGILMLWVIGMVFPINWLRRVSPTFRQHYDPLVPLEWVHIIMHTLLFVVLTLLLIYVFQLPLNRRTVLIVLGTLLAVGIFQEILQLQTKNRPFMWYEVYDLAVDLAAGVLGLGLAGLIWERGEQIKVNG
ncbi:MAG: VanZ family protein [Anaerolineales bacterium]|nr:VanZ family protein [Anaerolineales bacterium]